MTNLNNFSLDIKNTTMPEFKIITVLKEGKAIIGIYSQYEPSLKNMDFIKDLHTTCLFTLAESTDKQEIKILQELDSLLSKVLEINSLKQYIKVLMKANNTLKSKKVNLLLRLANDKACSYGELRNSILLSVKIFNNNGITV